MQDPLAKKDPADRAIHRGSIGRTPLWPFLDRPAFDRVLASAHLPLAVRDDQRQHLRRTLELITDELMHVSFMCPPTRDQVRQVRAAYDHLIRTIDGLRGLAFPAPPPPSDWRGAMERWLETEEEALALKSKGGAPIKHWDRVAYPRLLGFFELAYGRTAAPTKGGPAWRFTRAYLTEMHRVLEAAAFPNPDEQTRVLLAWDIPRDAALASKIRTASAIPVARMYFQVCIGKEEAPLQIPPSF